MYTFNWALTAFRSESYIGSAVALPDRTAVFLPVIEQPKSLVIKPWIHLAESSKPRPIWVWPIRMYVDRGLGYGMGMVVYSHTLVTAHCPSVRNYGFDTGVGRVLSRSRDCSV